MAIAPTPIVSRPSTAPVAEKGSLAAVLPVVVLGRAS
jgi:hypothetical protein